MANQGHNFKMEKAVKLEIKLDFPLMVPDLVYKFQMICIRGNEVIECKPNVGQTYKCTYRHGLNLITLEIYSYQ